MKKNYNQHLKLTFIIWVAFNPLFVFSQPNLLELNPKSVYVQNIIPPAYYTEHDLEYKEGDMPQYMLAYMRLELSIEKLPPDINVSNFSSRVKLYFKKGDRFEQVPISSWAFDKLVTSIKSTTWLTNNTPVAIYYEVDGVRSNTRNLVVVDLEVVPPTITAIYPSHITVTNDNVTITLVGKNLGQEVNTNVKINNIFPTEAGHNYMDGWAEVYVPKSVREIPGTYPVTITSVRGTSNTINLVVEKPVLRLAPVQKNMKPQETVFDRAGSDKYQQRADAPLTVISYGIVIRMSGTIRSETDRNSLENYCNDLDEVRRVENGLGTGANNDVLIKVRGFKIEKITLEHVKLSIEKKLKFLNVPGVVVIE